MIKTLAKKCFEKQLGKYRKSTNKAFVFKKDENGRSNTIISVGVHYKGATTVSS